MIAAPTVKPAEPPAPRNWPFPSRDPAERERVARQHQAQQRDWLRHEPEGLL